MTNAEEVEYTEGRQAFRDGKPFLTFHQSYAFARAGWLDELADQVRALQAKRDASLRGCKNCNYGEYRCFKKIGWDKKCLGGERK